MYTKENEARFERIKFELEMMSTGDLAGYARKLKNDIDEIKWKHSQTDEDKTLLWFKKRIRKQVLKILSSRQTTLF